jgi:hypothetical protein
LNSVISVPAEFNPAGHSTYGLGWFQMDVKWAPEPLAFHQSTNGLNIAQIWVDPKRDFAMVFATNIAIAKSEKAIYALAAEVYAKYGAGTQSVNPTD